LSVGAALAAVTLAWLLVEPPGWALARLAGLRADRFTRIWAGIVVTSVLGLGLARAGWFSLPALLVGLGGLVVLGAAAAPPARGSTPPRAGVPRGCGVVAVLAALGVLAWSFPPYDTTIAAADSTMYVSAGVHLARTGSLSVADDVVPLLPREAATVLFTSLGFLNRGPFVRLPGGLLMSTLEAPRAVPAFFPLLPVWTGILTLGGGPAAAPLAAPLFSALGVSAIVLLTGEVFGLLAAVSAGLALLANFALWWFARFTMPEPLALAAAWAGFALLRRADAAGDRRLAALAGAVLGLAGLARTEMFLFVGAAMVLAWAWHRGPAAMAEVGGGFLALVVVALLNGESSPSHHLTYLRNDLALNVAGAYFGATSAGLLGVAGVAAVLILVLLVVLGLVAALRGRRRGIGSMRGLVRFAGPLALLVALAVYVRVGGDFLPWRDLGWLAAYCSWPLLALAAAGAPLVWRRDGFAVRVAAWAAAIAAVVFLLNPRVAAYQPWAIRRFLPLVIPAAAVAGGAALAWIAERRSRLVALALLGLVVGLEVRPVLGVRGLGYYDGDLATVERLAARIPANAIVGIDSSIADIQLQVPLWLVTGRESLMLNEGGQRWQSVMRGLLGSGRPVMWISSGREPPRNVGDVEIQVLEPDLDVTVRLPDAPADTPPTSRVNRLVPLRLYAVTGLRASSSEPAMATATSRRPVPSASQSPPG
jgi:hypothetical protein